MTDKPEGPSAPKKLRNWTDIHPRKLAELVTLLMDSDDDENDSDVNESDNSDSESENESQMPNQSYVQQQTSDTPRWTSAGDVNDIPFIKHEELLQQPNGNSPKDYFNLLIDDEFLNLLVNETNSYATEVFLQENTTEYSRITRWHDVTVDEMRKFIGLVLHMGTIQLSRIQDYWKTHRLFSITAFATQMSRDRFMIIMRCLHFHKNPTPEEETPHDRLFKIRPLIDYFNKKMIDIYYPGKNLSLDESMVLWRGKLLSRQYIKNKRHKFGLKLYSLAEPEGTIIKFAVDTGVLEDFSGKEHAGNIVLHLMEEKLDVGHSIFLYNYYNSYDLARMLLSRLTYCTGMLRVDYKDNPIDVKCAKLKRGDTIACYSDGVMIGKWRDKSEILYISSEYRNEMVPYLDKQKEIKEKPDAVFMYNKNMKDNDQKDQMAYYPCERKTLRWYKKLGIHIIQMLMMNAFFLHRKYENPRMSLYDFRLTVIEYLLPPKEHPLNRRLLADEHAPAKNPPTGKKQHAHRRCVYCHKKQIRKETVHHCPACPGKPALCTDPCFKLHHEKMFR